MELTVLVDNNTYIDQYFLGEPALSFYIKDGEKTILFDTGYSGVLNENAKKMGIDLSGVDYIVLSHGHNDHTGGLRYLKANSNTELICGKGAFEKRVYEGLEVGSPIEFKDTGLNKLIETSDLYKLTDRLYFLGHIKRRTTFEGKAVGKLSRYDRDDFLYDDSALVYKNNEELFIITGCSHSGICNIILDAKDKLEGRIKGIIGGMHLLNKDEQLEKTIEFLKKENIELLYPSHCVSLYAKHRLYEVSDVKEVGVGLKIEL